MREGEWCEGDGGERVSLDGGFPGTQGKARKYVLSGDQGRANHAPISRRWGGLRLCIAHVKDMKEFIFGWAREERGSFPERGTRLRGGTLKGVGGTEEGAKNSLVNPLSASGKLAPTWRGLATNDGLAEREDRLLPANMLGTSRPWSDWGVI